MNTIPLLVAENWFPIFVGIVSAVILQLVSWTWHCTSNRNRIEIVKILFAHWSLWAARTFLVVAVVQVVQVVKLFPQLFESFESFQWFGNFIMVLACIFFSWCSFGLRNFLLRTEMKITNDDSNISEFNCLQQQLDEHKKWL